MALGEKRENMYFAKNYVYSITYVQGLTNVILTNVKWLSEANITNILCALVKKKGLALASIQIRNNNKYKKYWVMINANLIQSKSNKKKHCKRSLIFIANMEN